MLPFFYFSTMSFWTDPQYDANPTINRDFDVEKELLRIFKEKYPELLLEASTDTTKRWNIQIPLVDLFQDHLIKAIVKKIQVPYGSVNYHKKTGRFTHIDYSVRGKRGGSYLKRIAL